MLPFYTIGHSTCRIEEFVALLQAAEVTLIKRGYLTLDLRMALIAMRKPSSDTFCS